MNIDKIAKFLAQLRKDHNLTQQQLSEMVFVARESVSKWERAVNLPDHQSLLLLSKIYGITVNEILYGEYKTKENEEQINNTTITIMEDEEKKRTKIVKICCTIISILLSIFLISYFITNYNSIKVYVTSGESKHFQLQQGSIVNFQEKLYIQFGELINDTEEEILSVKLFYKNDNEKELISSNNDFNLLNGDISSNEIFENYSAKSIINNLYLEIQTENISESMKISSLLDYSNSTLFPSIEKHHDLKTTTTLEKSRSLSNNVLDKFKEVDGKCIYKTNNYTYVYDEELNVVHVTENIVYNLEVDMLKVHGNTICNINTSINDSKDCIKYKDEINIIKKDLFE